MDRNGPARSHSSPLSPFRRNGNAIGRQMPLREALRAIEIQMFGTLVRCVPGSLAYYYGENGEERVILHREN